MKPKQKAVSSEALDNNADEGAEASENSPYPWNPNLRRSFSAPVTLFTVTDHVTDHVTSCDTLYSSPT